MLFAMNIDDSQKKEFIASYRDSILQEVTQFSGNDVIINATKTLQDISSLHTLLSHLVSLQVAPDNSTGIALKKSMYDIREELYREITLPSPEKQSHA